MVWVSLVMATQAQQVRFRRDIAALTDEAGTIIHGTVISATVEPDPNFSNLTTVLVTINVQDVLKGEAEKSFTFRQYVWDIRERANLEGYTKGQEMLLFLRPPSRYGLTSPAGLDQGRFVVQRDQSGKALATNGVGNVGLFDDLNNSARAHRAVLPAASAKFAQSPGRPVDLDTLKQVVHAFAGAKR